MGCNCANCGNCGGCGKSLTVSLPELKILRLFGQIPFWPVARKADDMTPVYLEDSTYSREEYSLILQCLEKKSLISISYDKALSGADMSAYQGYPVHGSIALTERGYNVLDLLETQGIQ